MYISKPTTFTQTTKPASQPATNHPTTPTPCCRPRGGGGGGLVFFNCEKALFQGSSCWIRPGHFAES